ncbi:RNA-binding protein 5 isoform X2 [Drosophila kikkawai]|nr:RNA-binding protein 5 isoform X2 [Drosophila kikkawai]
MQYSHTRTADWTCIKCGASNFKRRLQCFMCNTSRAESENTVPCDGEGIDEVSDLLTKKIMLRNLDALTNEEGVLTALQEHLSSDMAKTVSKVQISRDTLTQASRGICYLNFDTLLDSMNMYNGLAALNPPLSLDGRTVLVSYCKDPENRKIFSTPDSSSARPSAGFTAMTASALNGSYTLADVPRLAAYSASVYASNPVEHAYYVQYYTDYYTKEISKQAVNPHLTEANSGAAVALSAIQRQQKKHSSQVPLSIAAMAVAGAKASFTAQGLNVPKGNDGKTYPTPDVSQYQYDETSGYYYDRTTGLYYDAHSQYYYNNETGAYLYWDQKRSTYVLATPASTQAALQEVLADAEQKEEEAKKAKEKEKDKEGGGNKHDKVKVAKKIVKDMEKWAKQLNQKKDYTAVATPQPILPENEGPSTSRASQGGGYADLGFSLLEKKERGAKTADFVPQVGLPVLSKLANAVGATSEDSEDESAGPSFGVGATTTAASQRAAPDEADYVDFQKLTCQLCKRAFQSLDILQKHLKISTLHKENLAKLNQNYVESGNEVGLSYRDRAKERRLKYGEGDPPPNRSRELFEQDMKTLQTRQTNNVGQAPAMPIGSSNVGNRLMQKMGWSEGQGLGKKNQGRTQIIEADGRTNNVGLGNKAGGQMFPGSDYKSYIKKMMKQRYDNA